MGIMLSGCQITNNADISESLLIKTLETIGVQKTIIEQSNQLIIVQTKQWEDKIGHCYLYERKDKRFNFVESFKVVIGRNGMKWGKGLHNIKNEAIKKEGDGTTPAGVFLVGSAFGNEPVALLGKWPYRLTTQDDYYIDDSKSRYYNQWVNRKRVESDWNSFEYMSRKDGLYNRGLVIKHNMDPVKPTYGSAIFFHIWRNNKTGTAGCTALSKHNMEKILHWIEKGSQPIVIQLPRVYLDTLL